MKAARELRNDIQGLRALAVLSVMAFHVNKDWLPGGFVGVDIFLVISGFLITQIVLRKKESNTFSFVSFYSSRFWRIVPAYFVLLLVVTICMSVLLISGDYEAFMKSLRKALYFNSNNYFASHGDYFAPASHELPLLHTWSLAVEMQFYLILPAIVLLTPRRFLSVVFLALMTFFVAYSQLQLNEGRNQATYYSLMSRIPEFLIGSMLALNSKIYINRIISNFLAFSGLALVAVSLIFISESTPFPGLLALIPCVGVALMISAKDSYISGLISRPILVYIGTISYSLYLWHWPVLAALRYYYEVYELSWVALLIFCALTFILAVLSYHFVESYFREKRSKGWRATWLAASICLAAMTLNLAGAINKNISDPLSVELTRYADPETICHGKIINDCLRGDLNSEKQILLMGDSHAAQLNHFADVIGQKLNLRIRVISASSCVPIEGFDVHRLPEWARKPCQDQISAVKPYIDSSDTVLLAGMWQYHTKSEDFIDAFDAFLSITGKQKSIIVLSQVPMLTSNPQRIHHFKALGSKRSAKIEESWKGANEYVEHIVSAHPDVKFLDLSSLPLFSNPPFDEEALVYHDNHHLNEIGSKRYGHAAAIVIGEIISEIERSHSSSKLVRTAR